MVFLAIVSRLYFLRCFEWYSPVESLAVQLLFLMATVYQRHGVAMLVFDIDT